MALYMPVAASEDDLQPGGRELWDSAMAARPEMPKHQQAILLEACRTKDRLDNIHDGLQGHSSLLKTKAAPNEDGVLEIRIDQAVTISKALGETMAKHLATLRLTTAQGRGGKQGNPGGTRAVYQPGVPSIERARQAAG